eukprot:Pgem_evm1s16675
MGGLEASDEEETEDIMNAVLDEIGVELAGTMAAAPSQAMPDAEEEVELDPDLMARLAELRA